MNIILRFIAVLIKCFYAPRLHMLDESRLSFHCFPTDCDLNIHMTNSRFLSFMDLGRVYLATEIGIGKYLFKKQWQIILAGLDITFVRSIKPFQRFTLISQVIYWDEKYIYMQQRIEANNLVCATSISRGLFLRDGKKLTIEEIQAVIDDHTPQPEIPPEIQHWKDLIEMKKASTT